jgi:paraquat-inducible protein A
MRMRTAAEEGLLVCRACELLNRRTGGNDACSRCGEPLHLRKPDSVVRSWAFLLSAAALYVQANIFPVLESGSLFGTQNDTILSGVEYLWRSGDAGIAVIIFIASIVLPAAKILLLAMLLVSLRGRTHWRPEQRTRIFRVLEVVGRWSMVDIFVAGVLVALVQFKTLAVIHIGPGALPFAAVVVLTLFASISFDPRLIWDQEGARA